MADSDVEGTFTTLIDRLNPLGLAYLHVVEQFPGEETDAANAAILDRLHDRWQGGYIANGNFDAARAAEWIQRGRTDAVTFGRPFIANPDLPRRYLENAPLNEPDQNTFYGGDERGYTDYPFLSSAA